MCDREMLLLDLRPSRQLTLVIFALHVLALLALISVINILPAYVTLLVVIIFLSSLIYTLKYGLQKRKIIISPDTGNITVIEESCIYESCYMRSGGYISDWLIVLVIGIVGERKPIYQVIMPDSIETFLLKKLRSLIKVQSLEPYDQGNA